MFVVFPPLGSYRIYTSLCCPLNPPILGTLNSGSPQSWSTAECGKLSTAASLFRSVQCSTDNVDEHDWQTVAAECVSHCTGMIHHLLDQVCGGVMETIAKSPIWKDSLILIVEDEPNHVDAARTVTLAVGPYVKRGVVVGDRYDQLSLLRTIEVALGLDPINLNDALAVPMFYIFNEKPNNSAYVLPQPSAYLMQADKELYKLKKYR